MLRFRLMAERRDTIKRLIEAGAAACAAMLVSCAPVSENSSTRGSDIRPLDSISSNPPLATVRQDLIATARERFGSAAVERALKSPTFLFVKRFAGMVPPPPPGADLNWRPPTPSALLIKDEGQWLIAVSGGGWREAKAPVADELDLLLGEQRFWSEPSYIPPCPDFGASLVLLKVPTRREVVRTSTCSSRTATAVSSALRG